MRKLISILFAITVTATLSNGAFAQSEQDGANVQTTPEAPPKKSAASEAGWTPGWVKKSATEHEKKLQEAEKKAADAEARAHAAEERAADAERKAAEAEKKAAEAEKRLADSQKKSAAAKLKAIDDEKKSSSEKNDDDAKDDKVAKDGKKSKDQKNAEKEAKSAEKQAKAAEKQGKSEPDDEVTNAGSSPSFSGHAHWYGKELHGRRTASGAVFDKDKLTAAHAKLRFGTRVKVVSKLTGKSTVVEINDRCADMTVRCIDLSEAAAKEIGIFPHRRNDVDCFVLTSSKK